jgi:4'-phosphopantetheinyl transferase
MPPSVDVWIAHERQLDDPAVAARLVSLLAPDELERRDRMATESGQRQQLLARALQRAVLSRYVPRIAPRDWRFVRGESGRPSLAPPFDAEGLNFNLAHTRGLVVMAVGRVAHIGIDVEALDKRVPMPVARRYFSEREVAALDALAPEDQPRRFLRLWTLKEAYLKAVGEGLAGGLDSMTFAGPSASSRRTAICWHWHSSISRPRRRPSTCTNTWAEPGPVRSGTRRRGRAASRSRCSR